MGANASQPEEEDKKTTYPNQVLYTDAFLQSAGRDASQDDQTTDEPPEDSNANDDDDYDINSMHVSTTVIDFEGGDEQNAKNTPDKDADTRAYVNEAERLRQMADTMTKSMHDKTADLKEKYPPTPRRSDVCDYARQAVYQCYEEHENKLDCKNLVDSYRQCSEKSATELRRNH